MFEPSAAPRVFALPPGTDFAAELVSGVLTRMADTPPDALARVTILVNTRRMQRRLKVLFARDQPRLLPRILLVTDADSLLPGADIPPPISPLRRRLELAQMVGKLIDSDPGIAPRAATVDLADSLAALMDEMQGEGVSTERLMTLDTGDLSGHWDRSLRFLSIVSEYTDLWADQGLDTEARRRRLAEGLVERWKGSPPEYPVIVAGSTGSRATTSLLMRAVASLPQGAVVLPGFDFDLPDETWATLLDKGLSPLGAEDHPQFRFADFLDRVDTAPSSVLRWTPDAGRNERNPLVSLSLRPAPATDQWLHEGPRLGDLMNRTEGLALMEAPQPRDEALAIAVALRCAVEQGKTAALITPDRTLSRRVAAALQRWDIVPDDSAGRPLSLTAPGRFLRQVAGLIGHPADPVELIALLKHPLAFSDGALRGRHLLLTRELELFLRRHKVPFVTPEVLSDYKDELDKADHPWCDLLTDWLNRVAAYPPPSLAAALSHHIGAAEFLAAGGAAGSGELWEKSAGRDTLGVLEVFRAEADFPAALPFADYLGLLERFLSSGNTRDQDTVRPDVMIWGTLEARVQGADLVVLGGLNDGIWPERPAADPWLNRNLRKQAGLLLPERQIGLSAHDYQQAIAAKEVILSRAKRDSDSQTVPSRWLGRLTNLLDGLKVQNGPEALRAMRAAGQAYIDLAARLDEPGEKVLPEKRACPAPPRSARPVDYTVTEIQRLIRDPYAIYARRILGLAKLDPLKAVPDARLRGEIFHGIVEEAFSLSATFEDVSEAAERFRAIAQKHLATLPWPGVRAHWAGHLDSILQQIVSEEKERRKGAQSIALEVKGRIDLIDSAFSIRGKADRIDRQQDGRLVIYDYKTGTPPSKRQIRYFDLQLPIEAVMAEQGGFQGVARDPVSCGVHIGLGRTPKCHITEMIETDEVDFRTATIKARLIDLLTAFDSDLRGYPSRRAMEKMRFEGDFDHLARFGEWDETQDAVPERMP